MSGSCRSLGLAFLIAVAVAGEESRAQTRSQAEEYDVCMSLANAAPEDALELALDWQTRNGGVAARHCAAVALVALDRHREAAASLEALAKDIGDVDTRLTVELLGQAGQAWLMAGETELAVARQSAALELAPQNVELLIDRSIAFAETRKYWEAIDDLNLAAEISPARAEVLILRASAYRKVDGLELAHEDIRRALILEPQNPEALLERGNLRLLDGDQVGARADWHQVIDLAPDSPAAAAASVNLANLETE